VTLCKKPNMEGEAGGLPLFSIMLPLVENGNLNKETRKGGRELEDFKSAFWGNGPVLLKTQLKPEKWTNNDSIFFGGEKDENFQRGRLPGKRKGKLSLIGLGSGGDRGQNSWVWNNLAHRSPP